MMTLFNETCKFRNNYLICLLIGLFTLCIPTIIYLDIGTVTQNVVLNERVNEQCVHNATKPIKIDDVAFITGGIGKYGKFPQIAKCFAFAESLERIGGWNGNIYILTDVVNITDIYKSIMYTPKKIKFIRVDPTRNGIDFRKHSAGGGGGYLKTMIFDFSEIKEDILIWHDCDKVVAKTNCIYNLFSNNRNVLNFNNKSNMFVSIRPWREFKNHKDCYDDNKYHRCGASIHVGTFIAHRKWSLDILHKWSERQQQEPSTLDRYTFYDAWHIDLPSSKVINIPKSFKDHMWNAGDVACINHITNTGRLGWRQTKNRNSVSTFLSSLCIKAVKKNDLIDAYLWKEETHMRFLHFFANLYHDFYQEFVRIVVLAGLGVIGALLGLLKYISNKRLQQKKESFNF